MMAQNQLQFIRRVLYRLKRRYGAKVDYYRIGTITVNEVTGLKTEEKTKYTLKRVIRLPVKLIRQVDYGALFKHVTYDNNVQLFVIDAKDIPIVPSISDYLIVNESRYTVKEVSKLDYDLGYSLMTEAIEDDSLGQVFEEEVIHTLNLNSGVTYGF